MDSGNSSSDESSSFSAFLNNNPPPQTQTPTSFRAMVQEFTGIPTPPSFTSHFPRTRLNLFAPLHRASSTIPSIHGCRWELDTMFRGFNPFVQHFRLKTGVDEGDSTIREKMELRHPTANMANFPHISMDIINTQRLKLSKDLEIRPQRREN